MRKKIKSFLHKLGFHMEPPESKTAFDLVCGMEISIRSAKHTFAHNNEVYHFCSESCYNHFKNDPGKYAGDSKI